MLEWVQGGNLFRLQKAMNEDTRQLSRLWGTSPGLEYIADPFPILAGLDLNDWSDWQTIGERLTQKTLYRE
jgi:hypothetical protein